MKKKTRSRRPTQAELDGDVFEGVGSQARMTEATRISLDLFQLKFWIEDYLKTKPFDPNKSFGFFLKEYISRINIKRKTFAADISINETLLSQFINKHRLPPDYIPIRLEIHSNNKIPAAYWYQLIEKERQHTLLTDKSLRKKQRKFVKNIVRV